MIDYDPCSEALYDDPFPFYQQLRDEAPCYYHPDYGVWFLSRFADILKAVLDLKSFTTTEGTTSLNLLLPDQFQSSLSERPENAIEISALSMLDPPLHTAIRAQLSAPFKPGAAETLEPFAREIVRGCLAEARDRGGLDAVGELAGRVSVRVACKILGVPLEMADQISEWVNLIFDRETGTIGMTERGLQGSAELFAWITESVLRWRAQGTRLGGLADVFLYDDFEGRKLNEFEATFHLSLVLIGGTETLPKAASAAIHRLAQHPDQRAKVAADPSLVPQAFHEALRYDMPTQMLGRKTTREVEFHGQTIPAGQPVMFLWASGNRDERQFERADQFDIQRGTPRILSFGQGAHTCLGAHVARMEGRVILEELLATHPDYVVDEDALVRMRSEFFRGFISLPIEWP